MNIDPPFVGEKGYRIGLGLAFFAAAAVRLWGIDYGLPQTQCRPDEIEVLGRSLKMLTGDLDPHFYNYPTLFLYFAAAIIGATFLVVRAKNGGDYDLLDFFHTAWAKPEVLYLPVRIVVALIGAATCLVVARTARRIFGDAAGISAAFLLAGAHLHVRSSHFALTDVPAAFFLALAVDGAVRIAETGTMRDHVWTGVWSGLAASTKYFGAFMAVAIAVLHIAAVLREKRRWSAVLFDLRPIGAASAMAAAFFLTSPYVLLKFSETRAALAAEQKYVDGGYEPIMSIGFQKHLVFTLPYGIGWIFCAAAAIGIVRMLFQRRRYAPALLVFLAVYYLIAGNGYTVFVRYFLPVVPILAVLAAGEIHELVVRPAIARGTFVRISALSIAILIVGGSSILSTISFGKMAAMDDTRVLAADWLIQNIPNEKTVAQFAPPYAALSLGLPLDSIATATSTLSPDLSQRRASRRFDFDPITARRWSILEYDATIPALVDVHGNVSTAEPDCIVVIETFERRPFDVVKRQLAASGLYKKAVEFLPARSIQDASRFDRQDSFFIPYRDYEPGERPGPDVTIWVKK